MQLDHRPAHRTDHHLGDAAHDVRITGLSAAVGGGWYAAAALYTVGEMAAGVVT
jgi:hypothetical protein